MVNNTCHSVNVVVGFFHTLRYTNFINIHTDLVIVKMTVKGKAQINAP